MGKEGEEGEAEVGEATISLGFWEIVRVGFGKGFGVFASSMCGVELVLPRDAIGSRVAVIPCQKEWEIVLLFLKERVTQCTHIYTRGNSLRDTCH